MDISMTAEAIGATITGTGVLGGVVMYVVRSEFARFSLSIEKTMQFQQQETREWVNGSFMRSATVGEQLKSMDLRLAEIERRMEAHIERSI
jgi:hypothetical protein